MTWQTAATTSWCRRCRPATRRDRRACRRSAAPTWRGRCPHARAAPTHGHACPIAGRCRSGRSRRRAPRPSSARRRSMPPPAGNASAERTMMSSWPASEVPRASASPRRRKSISGSGRSSRNGRTAMRFSRLICTGSTSRGRSATRRSSSAIADAEAKRSPGSLAIARCTTRSMATSAAEPLRAGGCSVITACSTSTNVAPRNGRSPVTSS